MKWFKRVTQLFNRDKFEDIALEPLYVPGDMVVVNNPYVLDGMVSDDIREPWVTLVEQSTYVANLGIFAYKLRYSDEWFNEAWLFPAEYGTETVWIGIPKEPSKGEAIDLLLDEYNDYKRLADEFGEEEYKEKLSEIKSELAMISEK